MATDQAGNTRTHTFTVTVVDNEAPVLSTLHADYFNGTNFNTFRERLEVTELNYNWGSGAPESNQVGSDNFSIRFTGTIAAPQTGTYTFFVTSDDGVRLWIDDQQIITDWSDHAPRTRSGTISLNANERVPLRLDYYERGGGAVVRLEWSGPGLNRQFVRNASTGSCQDRVVSLGADGTFRLEVDDVDPGYFDACGIASRVLSQQDFDCSDMGDNDVSLTVRDVNGNESSCTINVRVNPIIETGLTLTPSDVCQGHDGTVSISNSQVGLVYSAILGGNQIGSSVTGNGGDVSIDLPAVNLSVGNNQIFVRASNGICNVQLDQSVVVEVFSGSASVGIYHD